MVDTIFLIWMLNLDNSIYDFCYFKVKIPKVILIIIILVNILKLIYVIYSHQNW